MMLLEEMASIIITPYLLIFVVPRRVDDILRFISDFTVDIEGVGHVCSFSAFNFESHGNKNYGSPFDAARDMRSSQGKMEKSFLSFQSAYPTWEPSTNGRRFLATLCNFRDQQLHHDIYQNYPSPSQPWQFTQYLSGQGELIHRFPSRDVLLNIGNMPDHGIHQPYILDWYYISRPLHTTNTSRVLPLPEETMPFESTTDQLWRKAPHDPFPACNQLQKDTIEEEPWEQHTVSERLQSHFEASTSSPLLRDDGLHHHDAELHNMNHHWWVRSSQHATAAQGSFLEPPAFGRPDTRSPIPEASFLDPPTFGHHNVNVSYGNDNASERSCGEQEASDGRGRDWRDNSTMSRTVNMDDSDQDNGFGLHFANDTRRDEGSSGQASSGVFAGPLVSLPVRILPRSNDPVQGNISL